MTQPHGHEGNNREASPKTSKVHDLITIQQGEEYAHHLNPYACKDCMEKPTCIT